MTYQVNRDGTITVIKTVKDAIKNAEEQREYDLPANEDK